MGRRPLTVLGDATLTSPLFSNEWTLSQGEHVIARMVRHGRHHLSTAEVINNEKWAILPAGWGTAIATSEEGELGRIERRSILGLRWDLTCGGFGYDLVNRPRFRSWAIEVAGSPVAELRGSWLSYNAMKITSSLSVPVVAILLTWHVVARPWEQAAAAKPALPHQQTP